MNTPAIRAALTVLVGVMAAHDGFAQTHRVSLSRLGYPTGIQLEGTSAVANVAFPLPEGTRVTKGTVTLYLDITRGLAAGSNLQIFVNGGRRLVIPGPPDAMVPLMVTIPLSDEEIQRPSVDVQLRTSFAVGRDRCIDDRLASAYATILPGSQLDYEYDPNSVRSPAAVWSLLPDTVVVALPATALTKDAFERAYQLLFELRADGHAVTLVRSPEPANLALDSVASIRDLLAWRRLRVGRSRTLPNDPALDQLGISDLTRSYTSRGVWRLPLDLRALPPDRVPTAIDLEMSTAPGQVARAVQYFVFLNGTLLHAVTARDDGQRERMTVALPAYLLSTYNELRVEVLRQRNPGDFCQEQDPVYPAQILGSSVLHTQRATTPPRFFTGTALRLPEHFPLYIPVAALDSAEHFLPTIVSVARGTWGNRTPDVRPYRPGDALTPDSGFVVIGAPRGFAATHPIRDDTSRLIVEGPSITTADLGSRIGSVVVQVAHAHGQTGMLVTMVGNHPLLPDGPENYGNADVLAQFADRTVLRLNTQLVGHESLSSRRSGFVQTLLAPPTLSVLVGVLVLALLLILLNQRRRSRRRVTAA